MIPYDEALRLQRAAAAARGVLPEEEVPLSTALGRVAARDLLSAEPVPPFDNSAMDGWALASAKAARVPARLPVLGAVMAGDAPRCQAESGAWKIMTGAPLPAGCDAVVPVEKSRELDGGRAVELLEAPEPGDFVRGAGRDFPKGARVCAAGTRLEPRHLLALAATGAGTVPVRRRARIAAVATGRELAGADGVLKPGEIRDASSAYLNAVFSGPETDYRHLGVVKDDPEDFKERIQSVPAGTDLIVSTGAVSMGDADFIPSVLVSLGAEILFHKVAIRPGKPVLFARLPNGTFFFGLPGNPVSTVVGLKFFVQPLLYSVLGQPESKSVFLPLADSVEKPSALRCFFKALRSHASVRVLPAQASFQIHSLLDADCWAVLPEGVERLEAGTPVAVVPL